MWILQFADLRDYLDESEWLSIVDAADLHSLQQGMALARGIVSDGGAGAQAWRDFLLARKGKTDITELRRLWSLAETAGIERGVARAHALGAGSSLVDVEIYKHSTWWRQELLQAPAPFGASVMEPALFDPRNTAAGFGGADLLWRTWAGY